MWAHYANNGRGFVVEFRNLERVFEGDDTDVLSKPIGVRYDRERLSVTFETRSHYSLFFAKFSDWSYEQEVRIVLPLTDCRTETIGDHQIYVREIPQGCISRLILGWNMADALRKDVRLHVDQLNPRVDVVNAKIVRGRVELEPSSRT
jgi:hypothetical protein